MRVLRVYHAGRDAAHRNRERALVLHGVDVTLVVPRAWPVPGAEQQLSAEPFRIVELDVRRAGDVNRHRYAEAAMLRQLIEEVRPDVLDLHEEPVSVAARQWLRAAGPDLPVAMYTAQNLDKRFPPPFAQYERSALRRVDALYPCSRQAASVARGKGFTGHIDVLPLGVAPALRAPGTQSVADVPIRLGLIGRLVPEKGVRDAVRVLAAVAAVREARLHLIGSGPELEPALALAAELGVRNRVDVTGWCGAEQLAQVYRSLHVVLVPSRATDTWVEQFGRVIVEAYAAGAVVAGYASGAIAEVVGGGGVVAKEGDAWALGAAVTRLMTDPAEHARRREAAAAALPGYAWDEIARRQAGLYRLIASGSRQRVRPGRSAGQRRALACAEFGPPAHTPAGARPFALPVLRRSSGPGRALERVVDAVGAVRGGLLSR